MEVEKLLEKIKSYEWSQHIHGGLRSHEFFHKKLEEICELLGGCKKIVERIGYDILIGEKADLLRVAQFMEFDSQGTGFELFYEDSHTKAKWYIKEKLTGYFPRGG